MDYHTNEGGRPTDTSTAVNNDRTGASICLDVAARGLLYPEVFPDTVLPYLDYRGGIGGRELVGPRVAKDVLHRPICRLAAPEYDWVR